MSDNDISADDMHNYAEQFNFVRHQWIAVAAYYLAEKRAFEPGKELHDWLQAERDFLDEKIKQFMQSSLEDGVYALRDLQKLAAEIGVSKPQTFENELDIIRAIQTACTHRACFQSEQRNLCDETECQWRSECLKLIAVWNRRN